ncbi:ParB/RepB/Spo0J family partition protein [Streptomyces sp. 184]|uniref:ParB/RepB/Spo0J family partition protein n=1 Tax=Streptomyces sp. 184 TaxID=1827526 RepID=UPI003891E8EA
MQGHLDQMPVEVEVRSLRRAGSPRSSGEDREHVRVLAQAQAELPPIVVHRATMRVIDGLHRLRAAELRGQDTIAVRFFDGTEADAFVLAVESNIAHGLPLTMADRKRAASRIILSHPQWSDRMIASVTGIAPATVAAIRRRESADTAATGHRVGQDGRVRPLNGSEGRRIASRLINENPSLSLRQVARAAGISPETVRDVRNRMRRGEGPLPVPRQRSTAHIESRPKVVAVSAGVAGTAAAVRIPVDDRGSAVNRLKADPALRLSETGRTLLRLLNIHTLSGDEWEEIIGNVPAHCRGVVAQLARECAGIWKDIAMRMERESVQPL